MLLGLSRWARDFPATPWVAIPAVLFIGALVYHQGVRARRIRAERAAGFYRAGLDRLRDLPPAQGTSGDRFVDPHHPYAADLDLFGPRSLYERLCTARTPMGENVLADWLLRPADLDTIQSRQACVLELRDGWMLREDLALCGEPQRFELGADALEAWSSAPDALNPAWRGGAAALTAAATAGALVWAIWGLVFPFLAVLVVQLALVYALRARIHAAIAGIDHAYEDLRLIGALLRRIEAESFATPPLRALQERLTSHALTASATLSQLATVVNLADARRNPLLAPLLLPLMYTLQSALAAERWRRRHGAVVAAWLKVLGEFEALESLATYSFERPQDRFPEFVDGPAAFAGEGVGHPLIPAATRVCNDVAVGAGTRVLLVSGSNMSGKSTLLRAVGMNTVLAMAGAPVCALRLRLTPLRVGASIRVNDSLSEGSSRFYAEITRLKQLFAEPPVGTPPFALLFLLDELLQGTNSTDRRIGAQGVLDALVRSGAIGLVTTHDLTLTRGTELGPGVIEDVHFEDELIDGRLHFDFKLRNGVVTRSNGIELMRAIGLPV